MPDLADSSIQLLDGAITLTQRKRSSAWQARYKIGSKWIRATTKQKELDKAKVTATDLYLRAKYRSEDGLPVVSKRFKSVALVARGRLQAEIDADTGKKVYKDYVTTIDSYLIPFFGQHDITGIDYKLIKAFAEWRKQKMGREPKASTINTHNSTLNRIFEVGLEHNYLSKSQIPLLINKGLDSERRPDFTLDEYRQLFRFMRSWVKQGKEGKSRHMRELLRDYVLILANTGMRHGTESYGLKWKQISVYTGKNGRRYLMLNVNGKTGKRELVARHNVAGYLQRIHARSELLKHIPFDQLIAEGHNKFVFTLPDGKATTSLGQTFEILLKDAGLLVDRRTDQNRTLYSLRHTYATMSLLYARMEIHTLAKQMGTSVLMIEKHYSHLTPRMLAEQFAGVDWDAVDAKKKAAQ
jgi:integrase